MRPLEIVMLKTKDVRERKQNVKIHPERQIKQLMRSITKNGFYCPPVIDENKTLIAGHARVEAARRLELTEVPCVIMRGLSEAQKLALMLADNKIASNATTDFVKLARVFNEIIELDEHFDLTGTGYERIEIDQTIIEIAPEQDSGPKPEDTLPDIDLTPVTAEGDIWNCRTHRVACGSALDRANYERLLGTESACMVVTDPPYNLPIDGFVGGAGANRHREFAMASGEMTSDEFVAFLRSVFALLVAFSSNGSIHMIFMDWRHMGELLSAARNIYSEWKNTAVWDKGVGGMGTFYRSQYELVFIFKNGSAPHINNFELGQHGRYRTNVWPCRGYNSGGADRQEALSLHPTVKPVKILADVMLDCSGRGDLILDPFGGSGSTLIAAEKTGRRARIIEIDPIYVDRTILRWQSFAKEDAVHAFTGETFNERRVRLARERAATNGYKL